jgi:UrcA family protein
MHSQHSHRLAARRFGAGVFALAALSIAGSALSQVSVRVRYDDLDLNSPAGASVMAARINAAASRACGGEPVLWNFNFHADFEQCMDHAVTRAVRDLNAAMVTAKSGRAIGSRAANPPGTVVLASRDRN